MIDPRRADIDRRAVLRLYAEPVVTHVVAVAVGGYCLFRIDRHGVVSVPAGAAAIVGTVALAVAVKRSGVLPTVARESAAPPEGTPQPGMSDHRRNLISRAGVAFGLLLGFFVGAGVDASLLPLLPLWLPTSVRLFHLFVTVLAFCWMGRRTAEQFTPALPDEWSRPLDE